MKTVVIYHRADFDGIFCREIAKKFLPDAILIGWDYGDPVPDPTVVSSEDNLYMLDISIDGLMGHPRLIWIDHHKSAMDKFPSTIAGYRIDGVAACRLAWQWFSVRDSRIDYFNTSGSGENTFQPIVQTLPTDVQFKNLEVSEPIAVRLAGEYDVWDKRDPHAELFQHGLRSQELTDDDWRSILSTCTISLGITESDEMVAGLLQQGRAIQYAKTQENADIIKAYGFTVVWEGLTFLACNHARFNSHLFTAGIKPEHDALMGFNYDGSKGDWRFSLYHAPGKEHHDLSKIAVKHGGGGHRGACGFRQATTVNIIPEDE